MIRSVATLMIVATFPLTVTADEKKDAALNWMEYFAGEWTESNKVLVDGEEQPSGSANTKFRAMADGHALVGMSNSDNGEEACVLYKWNGVEEALTESGITNQGLNWVVVYSEIDAEKLVGKGAGAMPDGVKGEGTTTISRNSDDSYTVITKVKLESGTSILAESKFTREK